MKIKTKLGIGFGLQVLLTAVLGISALLGIAIVKYQFETVVERNTRAIMHAKDASKLVVDMETGMRGFVITGKEEFLEPYHNASKEFHSLISSEKERAAIGGNANSIESLERVETLLERWQQTVARPKIAMARKAARNRIDAEHFEKVIGQGKGSILVDKIMSLGEDIETAFTQKNDWEGAFATKNILKSMADREDSQRGFLITGKEAFLDKYKSGQEDLPHFLARLRTIVSERDRSEDFSDKIDQLEELTRQWTAEAAEPEIAARREMNARPVTLKDVAALVEAGTGKALIDQIRHELDQYIDQQENYAGNAYKSASTTAATTTNTAILLLLLATCLGLALAIVTSRAIARPLANLVKGAEAIGSGNMDMRIEVGASDEIGELAGAFNVMVSDLKESAMMRQQAENEMRQSENRFRDVATSMSDWIWECDAQGVYTFCSDHTYALLGYTPQELLGKTPFDLMPEEEAIRVRKIFNRIVANKEPVTDLENRNITKDGEEVLLLTNGIPMLDKEGILVGYRGVDKDITKRKQAEQAVRQAERLSALGTLASGIAHEINNPIGSATLSAEIALAIKDNKDELPQLQQCLNNISVSMDRCGQIVKNMLVFSLDKPSTKETGNINDAIQQSCHLTMAYAMKHQSQVSLELDDDLPPVEVNRLDMELVIINLIRNAIEATDTGGKIVIRSMAVEDGVSVSIEDNGCGMNEEQAKLMFDPFYTTRQDKGGTGLGCSIIYGIIQDHGGTVHVQSAPGAGTTVTVTLPTSINSLLTNE